MRLRWNPIVKKDLQVTARSMRLSWGLFAYEALLTMTFLLALSVIQNTGSSFYGSSNVYSRLIYLFPTLSIAQVCIVALIVPIITASSISGEKERQTFDIMLTTCMSPFSIVLGKVMSAVLRILFFVAAGLPIMALAFVVGGLSWSYLFYFVLTIILLSLLSGSIGILCSALCRRSITAVILSYAFYFAIYILPFFPIMIKGLVTQADSAGETPLLLLFNPIIFYEEFFMHLMSGVSLFSEANFARDDVGFITYHLAQGNRWMFASAACIFLLSVLLLLAAAWKVNPMHSSSGKKRKKNA